MNSQLVLSLPFDIETHKQTFIDYLEVIVLEDGIVVYAVPSHQEKLIALSCQKLGVSRDQLNDLCPPDYYFDFLSWLCLVSGCVALWNEHAVGSINEAQRETIHVLKKEGLYHGTI